MRRDKNGTNGGRGSRDAKSRNKRVKPNRTYAIGYGRPPVHSQFSLGKSGDPKGRPRGAKSLKNRLRSALGANIVVQDINGRMTMPVQLVLLQQQIELGLKG